MKKLFLLAALATPLVSHAFTISDVNAGGTINGYKQFAFGMTMPEIKTLATCKSPSRDKMGVLSYDCITKNDNENIELSTYKGELVQILAKKPTSDIYQIMPTLVAKYGEPDPLEPANVTKKQFLETQNKTVGIVFAKKLMVMKPANSDVMYFAYMSHLAQSIESGAVIDADQNQFNQI